jgi:hypothetical protein
LPQGCWHAEQHVHSFFEMIPLTAVILVSLLHWLKALLGLRVEPPSRIGLKREPLSGAYVSGTLAVTLGLEVLPYVRRAGPRFDRRSAAAEFGQHRPTVSISPHAIRVHHILPTSSKIITIISSRPNPPLG